MRRGNSGPRVDAGGAIRLYKLLITEYGPQGWWPLPFLAGAKGFDARGYHTGDFSQPRTARGRLEIIMGAVLTQNTAWTNVETALMSLARAGIDTPSALLACCTARLSGLIRSSGYHNQKARKLKALAPLLGSRAAMSGKTPPSREDLLAFWGVGEETADSILLYAFGIPVFIVDAYTRRLLSRIGWIRGSEKYREIQSMFHASLKPDHVLYNEYHALIVEHAKKRCASKPVCGGCPVVFCRSRSSKA